MDGSGQLQALAVVIPVKDFQVSNGRFGEEKNESPLMGMEEGFLDRPAHSCP